MMSDNIGRPNFSDSPTSSTKAYSLQVENKFHEKQEEYNFNSSSKSQPSKKPRKSKKNGKEDGRTTDIVPNVVKKIREFLQKQKKDDLISFIGDRPKEWTMKAEMIFLCLKNCQLDLSERKLFINEVTKILNKMIEFRHNKINSGERVQFHSLNKDLLERIKRICLGLLKKAIMPEPSEIHSILTELIKVDDENHGSLAVQSSKINKGFQYILKQFSIYSAQNEQDYINSVLQLTNAVEAVDIAAPSEAINYEINTMEEQNHHSNGYFNEPNNDSYYFEKQQLDEDSLFGCLNGDYEPQMTLYRQESIGEYCSSILTKFDGNLLQIAGEYMGLDI